MQIMEVESIEAYLLSFIEWLNVKRVFFEFKFEIWRNRHNRREKMKIQLN